MKSPRKKVALRVGKMAQEVKVLAIKPDGRLAEFSPWNPCTRRGESASESCPLTFICTLSHGEPLPSAYRISEYNNFFNVKERLGWRDSSEVKGSGYPWKEPGFSSQHSYG